MIVRQDEVRQEWRAKETVRHEKDFEKRTEVGTRPSL